MSYVWSVINLQVEPEKNGHRNVVKRVRWSLSTNDEGLKKTVVGVTTLEDPTETFIDYENLNEQTVIDWVHTTLGPERKNRFEIALSRSTNVSGLELENLPLPW